MRRTINLKGFEAIIGNLEPEVTKAVNKALDWTVLLAKREVIDEIDNAKPFPAVDTGGLRNSVKIDRKRRIISVEAPHAPHINYGTRPFRPPVGPILTWVIRKGLADDDDHAWAIAYAVCEKIAQDGIKPRFFMNKAMKRVVAEILPREVDAQLGQVKL